MNAPAISKQSLGTGYVVATGVALSVALLAHAVTIVRPSPVDAVILGVGLAPAIALMMANYWMPATGLSGNQTWTAAKWCGVGVALFTLINVLVLLAPVPRASMVPPILASGVAVGGFGGILWGWLLELRRSRRRLAQSNDVLFRVLRHDLRNDLNVALGHVSYLRQAAEERRAMGPETRAHVRQLSEAVDGVLDTTEKARQIEHAFDADRRAEPVDLVSPIRESAAAISQAYPAATLNLDLPEESVAYGGWMLDTVFTNVIENAVIHCEDSPTLYVSIEERDRHVVVHVGDNCPSIPQHERDVFESGTETPLNHSKGVGLWLTTWIVESYGGSLRFRTGESGNTVSLVFRGPTALDSLRTRLREWP